MPSASELERQEQERDIDGPAANFVPKQDIRFDYAALEQRVKNMNFDDLYAAVAYLEAIDTTKRVEQPTIQPEHPRGR